jgi:transposase
MPTDKNVDLLAKLAAEGRAMMSRREVATALNRSAETIDDWIAKGLFPRWVQQTPGGPKEQLVSVVAAWIEKRKRARYVPPKPRGRLRQYQEHE